MGRGTRRTKEIAWRVGELHSRMRTARCPTKKRWASDLDLSFLAVNSTREPESERDLVSVCKIKAPPQWGQRPP